MRILRTIETFYPYVCGPANQAYHISKGLEERGIESPVLTTYCDVGTDLPETENMDGVRVYRYKNHARLMRYCVSPAMARAFKDYHILHSHNYRNFQSDLAFFFHEFTKNPSFSIRMALFSVFRDTCADGGLNFPTGFMTV